MNKLLAFAVYDSKAEAYLRPFFAEAKGLAVRSFQDAVNDEKSPMCAHAADYTLFHVGSFDPVTGIVEGHAPVALGNGLTFQRIPEGVMPMRREA